MKINEWQDYYVSIESAVRTLLSEVLPLKTDSYKIGHWKMLPIGSGNMFSYGASRGAGGGISDVLFWGLQMIVKKHFTKQVTMKDIERAKRFADRHLRPGAFNYEGWKYIVEKHNGFLPMTISAVPEGTVLAPKNVLYSIEVTDQNCAWLVSYFEPLTLQVWYTTTVASLSYTLKKIIGEFWEQTVDDANMFGLNFALHDFGFRGATGVEAAGLGGSGHLLNFLGTDTMQAIAVLYDFYNIDEEDDSSMPAFSVYATEHTIMCANSDAENKDDAGAMEMIIDLLEKEADGVIGSAVADTYDVFRFGRRLKEMFGERLVKLGERGSRFVMRPDSGDPTVIPVQVIQLLMAEFGYTTNSKGFKVLPSFIRVLQGDGVDIDSIKQILLNLRALGISAENIVFGMGGGLLQSVTRDTLKFAQKASAIEIDGVWKDIFKDPITDPGKTSLKGRVETVLRDGEYITVRNDSILDTDVRIMREIFRDGKLLIDEDFATIRARVA